jgi:multidrug efflux pump subunit AcrA (membrane-fusion protein)
MVVPTIAVDYEPYGATVYTVQKGHAKLTYIQTDEMLNNQMVIKSGLQVGDQVVIAGQNKLHDGALVNVESKKCKKPIS